MEDIHDKQVCPTDDIAAYVDGELSGVAAAELERHVEECGVCSRSLREQRQFLAVLSASLDESATIDLPGDFAKKIVSGAESTVAGVRRPRELLTAVGITAGLLAIVLFAVTGEELTTIAAAGAVGEKLLTIASITLKTAFGVLFAVGVILRSLAVSLRPEALQIPAAVIVIALFVYFSSKRRLHRRNV